MLNRIIGILVVLAIGVLVYPFVFNPHDSFSRHSEAIQSPPFPSPQAQGETIKALSKHEEPAINKVRASRLLAKQKKSEVKITASTSKDNKRSKLSFKTVAWVIQVGSYTDKVKALSLVNQLRAKGYNAFIHQSKAAFGEEVQVYIGPEVKKDSAASIASKLAKETKLSGVVKAYKLLSA